jgi:hypothetical protein
MNIKGFLSDIREHNIPLHSFMIWQDGKVKARGECPQTPLNANHRMFSISKTLTAVAIGLLYSQGRLSPEDRIVDHFKDKLPEKVDPRIEAMTLKNMLMMRTCHSLTTYKQDKGKDWVASFFKVTPDHDPGTLWHYDTSSAHVLAALVERLSGMKILDYIRERLPILNFSGEAFFLCDEMGVPMGGTGLVCNCNDILSLALMFLDAHTLDAAHFIMKYGGFGFDAGVFQNFLIAASSFKSPTTIKARCRFESFGYGYMIWLTDHKGFMFYGMGGQFAAIYPGRNTILITTADTQNTPDGNDVIFDSFYKNILLQENDDGVLEMQKLSLPVIQNTISVSLNSSYALDANPHGFTELTAAISGDRGNITIKGSGKKYVLSFGIGRLIAGIFSNYDMRTHGFGIWEDEHMLYLRFYVIDSYLGSVHLQLHFSEDYSSVSVFMNKIEESLFWDFRGHLKGNLITDSLG